MSTITCTNIYNKLYESVPPNPTDNLGNAVGNGGGTPHGAIELERPGDHPITEKGYVENEVNMNLIEKAKREARKKGVKIKPDVLIGLRAIQRCHDIAAKVPGSAYELYMETKH